MVGKAMWYNAFFVVRYKIVLQSTFSRSAAAALSMNRDLFSYLDFFSHDFCGRKNIFGNP